MYDNFFLTYRDRMMKDLILMDEYIPLGDKTFEIYRINEDYQ